MSPTISCVDRCINNFRPTSTWRCNPQSTLLAKLIVVVDIVVSQKEKKKKVKNEKEEEEEEERERERECYLMLRRSSVVERLLQRISLYGIMDTRE